MSPTVVLMKCRLVGGPFDGTESEEVKSAATIAMRAGAGPHFAIYSRGKSGDDSGDYTLFTFDGLEERQDAV